MKKRTLSLLLALVLLTLPGCGTATDETAPETQPAETEGQPTETEAETETEPETDERLAAADGLPEGLTFGGSDFRIWVTDKYRYEIEVDGQTGDGCNDAVWERNNRVEEKYDVNIVTKITEMESDDAMTRQPQEIKNSVLAGADEFDIGAVMVWQVGSLIMGDCLKDWNDVKYINRDNPWWPQKANDAFTVKGQQYAAVTDLSILTLQLACGFLYNKQMAENANMEDLYTVVDEGRWTVDYLATAAEQIYTDANGNGERDMEDVYGFVGDEVTELDVWPAAFDIPLIGRTDDGDLELTANSDKMITGLEKILNLFYNNNGSYKVYYWEKYDMFKANQALFIPARIITLYAELRDMDVDFGVLPYPKYDENQQKYYGNSVDNYSTFCIPTTAKDTDITGAMLEALSCETYRTVIPAYYDVALTSKYTRDERSADMLDLIMDGRNYDISILHNAEIPRLSYMFRDLVAENNPNFASKFTTMQKLMNKGLERVNEKYSESGAE